MKNKEVYDSVLREYRMGSPHGLSIQRNAGSVHCPEYLYESMMDCWHFESAERPFNSHSLYLKV